MFIFKRLLCLSLSVWATRKNYRVTSDCLTPKVIFLKFPTPPIWSLARTLVTLNSQISWGWWNGGGVGACWCSLQRRLSFVWGSLARRLMLMSLFHPGKKRKKNALTETSVSIPELPHAFWPNDPQTENTFKKTGCYADKPVQNNWKKYTHENLLKDNCEYWLLIEWHLI